MIKLRLSPTIQKNCRTGGSLGDSLPANSRRSTVNENLFVKLEFTLLQGRHELELSVI